MNNDNREQDTKALMKYLWDYNIALSIYKMIPNMECDIKALDKECEGNISRYISKYGEEAFYNILNTLNGIKLEDIMSKVCTTIFVQRPYEPSFKLNRN